MLNVRTDFKYTIKHSVNWKPTMFEPNSTVLLGCHIPNTYIPQFTHHSALVIRHHHSAKYPSQIFCILPAADCGHITTTVYESSQHQYDRRWRKRFSGTYFVIMYSGHGRRQDKTRDSFWELLLVIAPGFGIENLNPKFSGPVNSARANFP